MFVAERMPPALKPAALHVMPPIPTAFGTVSAQAMSPVILRACRSASPFCQLIPPAHGVSFDGALQPRPPPRRDILVPRCNNRTHSADHRNAGLAERDDDDRWQISSTSARAVRRPDRHGRQRFQTVLAADRGAAQGCAQHLAYHD